MNPHRLSALLWPIVFAAVPVVIAVGVVLRYFGIGG
jgi:hypothetical protein